MHDERSPNPSRTTTTVASLVLFVSVVAVYGTASFVMDGDANVTDFSSGIYDMDIQRVVTDLTSRLEGYRTSVHPLQKILIAPIGIELNSLLFGGGDRLATAKLLVGAFVLIQGLLVCVLAYQLSEGAWPAALAAGAIHAFSFASLLAASLPESAALASVASTIPLIWGAARTGRAFTGWEVVVWALIGVLSIGLTITQIACWSIALVFRVASAHDAGVRASRTALLKAALCVVLLLVLTGIAVEVQARMFEGTPRFYMTNPVAGERPFFRLGSIAAQPIYHTFRLLAHFSLFDFVAPFPGFSDFLIRDYVGFEYWSLSIEAARVDQVNALQWMLAVAVLCAVVSGCIALRRAGFRFVAPGLCVAFQFGLHFFYGREYVLYAPHWHGVWVAMLVAAVWNAWPRRRSAMLLASGLLCVAMLANNLAVLAEVYREVEAGLQVSVRDSHGALK